MPANPQISAVQRSQEFYRLKEIVDSPGFIRELDNSSRAIYIGPDSDISEVQVQYFNPDEPESLETAVVAVNGPLVGRVDSLPITKVPSTGQPARILVSPVDLVDNNYTSPVTTPQRRFNIAAYIDLMVALKTLPDIPQVRADRTLRLPGIPYNTVGTVPNDGSTDLFVPIYGRRMVTVTVIGNSVDVTLSLVNLIPGIATIPRELGTFGIPLTIPPTPQSRAAVIRASDAGRVAFQYDLAPAISGYTFESDSVGTQNAADNFGPQPRGMADLLQIHIANPAGAVVDVTRYVTIEVKVADRES